MATCHRNDVAAAVLRRSKSTRLWSACFRRLVLDSVTCGASRTAYEKADDNVGSEELSEDKEVSEPEQRDEDAESLLKVSEEEEEEDEEVRRKEAALEEMKAAVRRLQRDDSIVAGAVEVRRMAKESAEARIHLGLLGAIPPLVAILDGAGDDVARVAALYALLNLGIGNDANKAAIVKSGAIHKMVKLIRSPNPAVAKAIVANFLGLSASDPNKLIIGSSGAIPFLVNTLRDSEATNSLQSKHDALRALYNLSISPANVPLVLETNLVPVLLNTLGDMEVSERILSLLSNVVANPEGRKAVSSVPNALPILIDALNWSDAPVCQEKASYVLMVLAHKSYGVRQSMIEGGIASSLLELTLVGSTLSQKRASRILECLRTDKGKQLSGTATAVSAPMHGSPSTYTDPNLEFFVEETMSEERKAVKQLVEQSLQNNMRKIAKRANLPQDFVPSYPLKSLAASSTSKSLPF